MVIIMPMGTQSFTYDCGIKVLQLVLAYYGIEVQYHKLLYKNKNHKRYGIPQNKLTNIARGYGLKAWTECDCTLDTIRKSIKHKTPVIVLIQAWAEDDLSEGEWRATEDYGHYSIVVGIERGKVFLNDPLSFNRVWLTEKEFLNRWHGDGSKRFALFIEGKPITIQDEHIW